MTQKIKNLFYRCFQRIPRNNNKARVFWYHVVSPFALGFSFVYTFFSLSFIFWCRLLRASLPNFFASMNPIFISILCLVFFFLSYSFLYLKGYFPWKPRGAFISWVQSKPGGIYFLKNSKRAMLHINSSQGYVFLFFWEKISPEKSLFLSPLAKFFWSPGNKILFYFYYFILCLFPIILVLSIFSYESFFGQSFHYFYLSMPFLMGPFLYNSWWCFWDAWAAGIIQHISQFYLDIEEKEDNLYSYSALRPLDEPSLDFWLSLWKISVHTQSSIDESREIYSTFNPWLSLFVWSIYFLGWLTILLRFFILS